MRKIHLNQFKKTSSRFRWAGRRRADISDNSFLLREIDYREQLIEKSHKTIEDIQFILAAKEAELEALSHISHATGSAFDPEVMLNRIAEIAERITGTENCHIYLYNEDKTLLILSAASEDDRQFVGKVTLDVGEGITGWVAKERRHVACSHKAYEDHRFIIYPDLREYLYESFLSVPLVIRNEVIGVINVRTHEPRYYTSNQVRLLSGIASHVAGALDHMSKYRRLQAQASRLNIVTDVSKTIASRMYLDEVLQLLVNLTAKTLNYKICTVRLLDEPTQTLVLKATQTQSKAYLGKPSIRLGESIAGKAVLEQKIIIIDDVRESPEYRDTGIAMGEGLVSLACVPLIAKSRALGALNCYTGEPHVFSQEEIATLELLANQAAMAIDHTKLMVRSAVLQEMHHRIKNNLQQIASLLRLQRAYSSYNSIEEAIDDSLGRILAIAAVHELLSREDLDQVSIKKLADSILHHTQQSLIPPGSSVRSSVTGDDFLLPLNQATSIALVLNELIQNAVEHGFADSKTGSLKVLTVDQGDTFELIIENDGLAIPEDFDLDKRQNMGLRIVRTLVHDSLEGKFTISSGEITRAVVTIPKNTIYQAQKT